LKKEKAAGDLLYTELLYYPAYGKILSFEKGKTND